MFGKGEIVAVLVPAGDGHGKTWWLAQVLHADRKSDNIKVQWYSWAGRKDDSTRWTINNKWGASEVGWDWVMTTGLKLDAQHRLTTESWKSICVTLERHVSSYQATKNPLVKYHQNALFVDAAIAVQKQLPSTTLCIYLEHLEFGTTKVLLERTDLQWSSANIMVPQKDDHAFKKMAASEYAKRITLISQTLQQLISGVAPSRVAALMADFTGMWSTNGPSIELAFTRKVFAAAAVLMITISMRQNEKYDSDDSDDKCLRRDIMLAQIDVMRWAQLNGYIAITRNLPNRWLSEQTQPAIVNGNVAFLMFDISTPKPSVPQTKSKKQKQTSYVQRNSKSKKRHRTVTSSPDQHHHSRKRVRRTSKHVCLMNDPDN